MDCGKPREDAPYVARAWSGDVDLIEQWAVEWTNLCDEGPCDEPFYRPEWVAAYVRAFEPRSRVVVLTVHHAGRLRGILPLIERRYGVGPFSLGIIRGAANVHSCRFDLVHGVGDKMDVVTAMWHCVQAQSGWSVFRARDVVATGAMVQLVALAQESGYAATVRETLRMPYIPLNGCAKDGGAFAKTNAKFRANLRRRRAKLAGMGELRVSRVGADDDGSDARVEQMVEEFFALEQSGWKGAAGTAISCDDATRQFYLIAYREAHRHGYLSLYRLESGDRLVAAHLGLTHRDRYFVPKLAYDEEFRACSPGQLLVADVLQDCHERGVVEFDFLGPMMDWKSDWTKATRPHLSISISRSKVLGWGISLAEDGIDVLKRLRRTWRSRRPFSLTVIFGEIIVDEGVINVGMVATALI